MLVGQPKRCRPAAKTKKPQIKHKNTQNIPFLGPGKILFSHRLFPSLISLMQPLRDKFDKGRQRSLYQSAKWTSSRERRVSSSMLSMESGIHKKLILYQAIRCRFWRRGLLRKVQPSHGSHALEGCHLELVAKSGTRRDRAKDTHRLQGCSIRSFYPLTLKRVCKKNGMR